jgi:protein TonB
MASEWRNPRYDIKAQSKTVFEQAVALSLAFMALVFMTNRTIDVRAYDGGGSSDVISVEQIPETQQLRRPPAPQRPQIPIATESEDIPDDVTIIDTEIDLSAPPPPPPPPPGSGAGNAGDRGEVYMTWEEAPQLVRMVTPTYPELARKAGVEGKVILQIIVDENGDVRDPRVIVAQPPGIFEEAAIEAVLRWKFKPAKQRGNAISVLMGQQVDFSLTGNSRVPPL